MVSYWDHGNVAKPDRFSHIDLKQASPDDNSQSVGFKPAYKDTRSFIWHKLQNIRTVINIIYVKQVVHLLILRQGEYKQQQQHGEDEVLDKSWTSGSLCRSLAVWELKASMLQTQSPAVVPRSVGSETRSARRVQQLDPRCCGGDGPLWEQQPEPHFCPFPFPATAH